MLNSASHADDEMNLLKNSIKSLQNQSSIDGRIPARYNDVIKIILNLDKNRENGKNGLELLQKTPISVLKVLHCP